MYSAAIIWCKPLQKLGHEALYTERAFKQKACIDKTCKLSESISAVTDQLPTSILFIVFWKLFLDQQCCYKMLNWTTSKQFLFQCPLFLQRKKKSEFAFNPLKMNLMCSSVSWAYNYRVQCQRARVTRHLLSSAFILCASSYQSTRIEIHQSGQPWQNTLKSVIISKWNLHFASRWASLITAWWQ